MTGPPTRPSDDDPTWLLVQRMLDEDEAEASFEILFRRHRQRVSSYFRGQGCNPSDCEDLTQETFSRVYRYIGSVKDASLFDGWLLVMTMNVFRNKRRWRSTHTHHEVPLGDLGTEVDSRRALVSLVPNPFQRLWEKRRVKAVRRAIEALPPQMRRCVLLRGYHELEYREIARAMGITIGAVSAHLSQARERLAKLLDGDAGQKGIP